MVLFKKYPIIRLVLLVVLIAADAVSTYLIIRCGYGEEDGPLARIIIAGGWDCFIAYKIATVFIFCLLVIMLVKKNARRAGIYASVALFGYLAIYLGGTSYCLIRDFWLS